ncbi:hypothetical protein LIER_08467 [Lithospermum erythrorhizon]|uniref:Reverse transcriptase domain-containing protein n=1 Tax=Lithospermum erythrorhizon TaxID=34254 RepID=A0AAV3PG08_LITER
MVNRIFKEEIGRNMEIYVDDMLVKSRKKENHLGNLRYTLEILKTSHLHINPENFSFGVTSGRFLGFMIIKQGIEPNPDKIENIQNMEPPKSNKEVQRLTSFLAALSRFISKSGDRNLPYFRKIRQASTNPSSGMKNVVKAQAPANFILECTARAPEEVLGPREGKTEEAPRWKLYVDGASNEKGSRARILIEEPESEIFEYALRFSFKATNNKAQYKVVVTGLQIAQAVKI